MRIPFRIALPVAGAFLLVCVVIVGLFLQLEGTRATLSRQFDAMIGTGALAGLPSLGADIPVGGDESLLQLRRGDVFALRGEWVEAEKAYRESAAQGGGLAALHKLAQAQLQLRDIRGARETLDRLRREGARDEDVLLLESTILMRTGEITKARELLQAADDSPHKQYGMALLSVITGDHEGAKGALALVIGGWEPILRANARTLLAAYEEYALFPDSPDVHLSTLLGRALAQVQECELALPMLSQVTMTQADYRDAWVVQGFCELSSGRITEARASLERAYQLDPEKPQIQYFLARAYRAQGDHRNALTFFQYALKNGFEPESEVRRLLAQEALENGNATLALEQYEALAGMPDATLETYDAYVTAALTAGKIEEAFLKAQEAAEKWPDDPRARELVTRAEEARNGA